MCVQESIRIGTSEWEELVPSSVSSQIKRLGLLGYSGNGAHNNGHSNGSTSSNGATFVADGKASSVERTGAVSSGQ